MAHLWEVDHDYYCQESNYYSNETVSHFRSWGEFEQAEGDADMDYNLVFRWDWREGEGWDLPEYNGDDNYRHAHLTVYFMGQRNGLYRAAIVEVCRADEPAILAYLKPRWEKLRSLWEPIATCSTALSDLIAGDAHLIDTVADSDGDDGA